ncbi:MAG: hypothetical protein Q7J25_13750 [Vicinamibacterales bacterium]|nr:hypothetical protein [Vicinamibacterales bacterium]
MNAELLKLRVLPTPRLILALCFGSITVVALIVLAVRPSNIDVYREAPDVMAQTAVVIGAIVFGAWVTGVEFAQGTLRRALIAEPRRATILLNKYAVILVASMCTAALCAILALALGKLTASVNTVAFDSSNALKEVGTTMLQAGFVSTLSASITLLLRSFAGGLIGSFVLLFVIDGVLQLSSAIRHYTFGSAMSDIAAAAGGDIHTHSVAAAALIAAAWVTAAAVPAAARFMRGDCK